MYFWHLSASKTREGGITALRGDVLMPMSDGRGKLASELKVMDVLADGRIVLWNLTGCR